MLSTKTITHAGAAAKYYSSQDNYYTKGCDESKSRSEWWGDGAKRLGLKGPIHVEDFERVLSGRLPNGEVLGSNIDTSKGEVKRRYGFDLTFSAPKSVSIAALLGGDDRLIEAVKESAKTALDYVEKHFAQGRTVQDGETKFINTKNLLGGLFLHDLSFDGDPQLHLHSVIMSATELPDKKWRCLASQSGYYGANADRKINGFIEQVRHYKKYLGSIFHAELAYKIKQLGYDLEVNKHGKFEIKGISETSKDIYSQRRKAIEKTMQEYGISGAKAAAMITASTRKKRNINRETIKEFWAHKAEEHGFDTFGEAKYVVEKARSKSEKDYSDQDISNKPLSIDAVQAKEAIQYALQYLSESKSNFAEIELLDVAVKYAMGSQVNLSALTQALDVFIQNGQLIPIKNAQGVFFTTKIALDYEKNIIHGVSTSLNHSLIAKNKTSAFLQQHDELDGEQKTALRTIAASDRIITGLEGNANSGKTELIQPLAKMAKLDGYEVIVLSANQAASKSLKKELESKPKNLREFFHQLWNGNDYSSLQSYIGRQAWLLEHGKATQNKKLIIVDGAEQLSTKQLFDLKKIAEKIGGKIVLSGDRKAPLSWLNGNPFIQSIDHGMVTATISGMNRSHEAIQDTLAGRIDAAFKKIGERVLSVSDSKERLQVMSHHYVNLHSKMRDRTLLLMQTNAQCEEMNQQIHDLLKDHNQLDQKQRDVSVLLPVFVKTPDYQLAKTYKKGQVVRFNQDYASLRVSRGDYLKIIDVYNRNNTVVLENQKGKKILWNPQKTGGRASGAIELFKDETRNIHVGETLSWKRNDRAQNIAKGEKLKVVGITPKKLVLERSDKKQVSINLKYHTSHHFDYGYATTAQQAKHFKPDQIIAYLNSASRQSHQRGLYKLLSQAKKYVSIYTENGQQLRENLQKHTDDKTTTLDTVLGQDGIILDKTQTDQNPYIVLLEQAVEKALIQSKANYQTEKTPKEISAEAVQYALSHLSAREAAFEHKAVMETALAYCIGESNEALMTEAILQAEKEGQLIRGVYSRDGTKWTTKEAVEIERQIMDLVQKDQKNMGPLAKKEEVKKHLETHEPIPSHRKAIEEICTSQDRAMVLQGRPGTGKTTLLMNVKPLMEQKGYNLLCLAPTHTAVKELRARGLEAQTLASFIGDHRITKDADALETPKEKLFIALDENSMTSNQAGYDFLKILHAKNARVIFMGDHQQLPAIESGKPHYLSMLAGAKTIYLDTIIRQKNQNLLKAANEAYENKYDDAFKTLKKHIVEIGKEIVDKKTVDKRSTRLEKIRDDYLDKSQEERAKTLIITFGNEERMMQNELIREGLKGEGKLYGDAIDSTILVQKDMTEVERTKVQNYLPGEFIRFGYTDKTMGIQKGDYLQVADADSSHNIITLINNDGETVVWQPKGIYGDDTGIEVYEKDTRELMAGDLIRWTRSQKELGLLSPELAVIDKIENGNIFFRHAQITKKGITLSEEIIKIDPKNKIYQHWDHAYAVTSYSSQGKTVHEALINAESYHEHLTTQRTMLVAMTRAVHKITIYTNDKSKLIAQLEEHPGDKSSALETIGEIGQHQNQTKNPKNTLTHSLKKPTKKNTQSQQKNTYIDGEEVSKRLSENAATVVHKILGEPKSRTGDNFTYSYSEVIGGEGGKREGGSLSVAVSGSKQGYWNCFKNGLGGRNLMSLIQLRFNLEYKEALKYAVDLLGMSQSDFQKIHPIPTTKTEQNPASLSASYLPENWSNRQKSSVKYARKLARESKPIEGTLAEKYLRDHRGIYANLPKSFRFHPEIYSKINGKMSPALLVVGEDKGGKVQSVQAIFLNKEDANKDKTLKLSKQTWGVAAGAPATIGIENNHDKNHVTYVAEGPETAMSILEAMPNSDVKITFGKSGFRHVHLSNTNTNIVLCLDNDADNKATEMLTKSAAEELDRAGKTVWIAKPKELGKDYNDLIQEQGKEAVKENIEQAISYENYVENKPSETTLKTEILEPLKQELDEKIDQTVAKIEQLKQIKDNQIQSVAMDLDDIKTLEDYTNVINNFDKNLHHQSLDISDKDIEKMVEINLKNAIQKHETLNQSIEKEISKEQEIER